MAAASSSVDRITEAPAGLVDDGSLRTTERVQSPVPTRGGDGHGRRGPRTAEEGGSGPADDEASTEETPAG